MDKVKFMQTATTTPEKVWRMPIDVLRDRRLSDDERANVLRSWRARSDVSQVLRVAMDEALAELARKPKAA
jgi:hypothetical protein